MDLQSAIGSMISNAGDSASVLADDAQKDMNDPANLIEVQQHLLELEQEYKSISAMVAGIGSVNKSIIDRMS